MNVSDIHSLLYELTSFCRRVEKRLPPTPIALQELHNAFLSEPLLAKASLFVHPAKLDHTKVQMANRLPLNEMAIYFSDYDYFVLLRLHLASVGGRAAKARNAGGCQKCVKITIEKGRRVALNERGLIKQLLMAVVSDYQSCLEYVDGESVYRIEKLVKEKWNKLAKIYMLGESSPEDISAGIRYYQPFLYRELQAYCNDINQACAFSDCDTRVDSSEIRFNLIIMSLIEQYPELLHTCCQRGTPFHIEWIPCGQTTSYTQGGSTKQNEGANRRKVIGDVIGRVMDLYFSDVEKKNIKYLEGGAAGGELLQDVQHNLLTPDQIYGFDYFNELVVSGRARYKLRNFIAASGDHLPYSNDLFDLTVLVLYLAQLEDDFEACRRTGEIKSAGDSLLYKAVQEHARISRNGSLHLIADRDFHVVLVRYGFLLEMEFRPSLILYRLDKTPIHGLSPWGFTLVVKKLLSGFDQLRGTDLEDISFRERQVLGAEMVNQKLRNLLRFYSLLIMSVRSVTLHQLSEAYGILLAKGALDSANSIDKRLMAAVQILGENVGLTINDDVKFQFAIGLYKSLLDKV